MNVQVVTLFPEMFEAVSYYGVTGRAVSKGLLSVTCVNPRDFTTDRHQTVDSRPYGGGPGMVMMVEPLRKAIAAAQASLGDGKNAKVIYMSPQGKQLNQAAMTELANSNKPLIVLAGRYEGVDQRLLDAEIDEEWSIGDYVLSGGELPAMVLIDGVSRLLPGVLGDENSAEEDSFSDGLLDHPHYSRPEVDAEGGKDGKGSRVPHVLLSGNHEEIRRWRLKQSLGQTWLKRPDLLADRVLSEEEEKLLSGFQDELHLEAQKESPSEI